MTNKTNDSATQKAPTAHDPSKPSKETTIQRTGACHESQGDGVPCPDLDSDCENCDRSIIAHPDGEA